LNIFLDSSVAIAASLSATGASHQVFDLAPRQGWSLIISPWVLREVRENLRNRPEAGRNWNSLRRSLVIQTDELIFDWPLVFEIAKDKPILVTALACADVLPTLDRRDFGRLIGQTVYGLGVRTPGGFIREEREAGRLSTFKLED
jgi:predicted nucleic acid-binding protein